MALSYPITQGWSNLDVYLYATTTSPIVTIKVRSISIVLIYSILDDDEDPMLRKDIYIGGIGQVTVPNGRSPSGGPEGSAVP